MEDWEQYRAWRLLKESEFTCLSFSQLIRCEILLKRPIVIAAAHGVKWGIKISTFYSNLRWCIGTSSFINVNFRISSEVPWCKSSIASWNEDSGSKRDQRALTETLGEGKFDRKTVHSLIGINCDVKFPFTSCCLALFWKRYWTLLESSNWLEISLLTRWSEPEKKVELFRYSNRGLFSMSSK